MSDSILNLIESILMWEGQFNSQTLMERLGVSRPTVSKQIGIYKKRYPKNIYYDASAKFYFASKQFQPVLGLHSLIDYCQQHSDLSNNSFSLPTLQQAPKPSIARPIIRAIRKQQRLDIRYISMTSPEFEERIISPHSLVFDGKRHHVRAWCEKNQEFRDFVLSRIHEIYAVEGQAEKTQQDDLQWQNKIAFLIEPEPRLTQQQQKVIALDYGMQKNSDGRYQRSYTVKVALLLYYLQQLRIETTRKSPESQQIILSPESRDIVLEVLPFLKNSF